MSIAAPAPAAGSIEYFALLYTPRAQRPALATLIALREELEAGIDRALDHAVAHARLEWWRAEAARFVRGEPQHPWLRALWQQDEASRALDLSRLIDAGARDLATRQLQGRSSNELQAALFHAAAQLLGGQALSSEAQRALAELARRSAASASSPSSSSDAELHIEPALQPRIAPLLVWYALAARRDREQFGGDLAAGEIRRQYDCLACCAPRGAGPLPSEGLCMSTVEIDRSFRARADELQGRVIAITGAGDGIGRAVALAAAAHGAEVVLIGRTVRKLEEVHARIARLRRAEASIAPLDLETRRWPRLRSARRCAASSAIGRLDGLVHIAGILGVLAPIEQYDVPTWCRVLHVNLTAAFALTQVLLPALRAAERCLDRLHQQRRGAQAAAYWGAYAVSKVALETLSGVLAEELESGSRASMRSIPGRCAPACARRPFRPRIRARCQRPRRSCRPICGCSAPRAAASPGRAWTARRRAEAPSS